MVGARAFLSGSDRNRKLNKMCASVETLHTVSINKIAHDLQQQVHPLLHFLLGRGVHAVHSAFRDDLKAKLL